jgi:hypothetical protein
MKVVKSGTTAKTVIENLSHIQIHNEELTKLYPDLSVVLEGSSLGDNLVVDYYSPTVNSEADQFQFAVEHTSTYIDTHTVRPYKAIQVSCLQCNGLLRVNSIPSRIPLYIEIATVYLQEYEWYALMYEELLKVNNFNSGALAKIQLYILARLEDQTKLKRKVELSNMSNSIKKLLPFT